MAEVTVGGISQGLNPLRFWCKLTSSLESVTTMTRKHNKQEHSVNTRRITVNHSGVDTHVGTWLGNQSSVLVSCFLCSNTQTPSQGPNGLSSETSLTVSMLPSLVLQGGDSQINHRATVHCHKNMMRVWLQQVCPIGKPSHEWNNGFGSTLLDTWLVLFNRTGRQPALMCIIHIFVLTKQ